MCLVQRERTNNFLTIKQKAMKKILYIVFLLSVLSNKVAAQQTTANNKNINITNFTVYAKDTKIIVDWTTDGTVPTNTWEVQRSTDGAAFTTIALVLGADPRQEGDRYGYAEKIKDTKNNTAWYRLRHVDANGKEQFSNVIQPLK